MLGRLKGGLVVVAVLALCGAAAPLAQAANFEAESYPAAISGSQIEGKHSFKTVANELSCNKYDFTGELVEASNELALAGNPAECSTAGVVVMTVAMNGCTFNFNVGKEGGGGTFSGSAHIACPAGKEIVWTASSGNCTAKIPPQVFEAEVTLTNTATEPKKTIKLTTEATGVDYTLGPTSGCLNFPAPGTYKNGLYKGTTTLKAAKPKTAEAVGLTVK